MKESLLAPVLNQAYQCSESEPTSSKLDILNYPIWESSTDIPSLPLLVSFIHDKYERITATHKYYYYPIGSSLYWQLGLKGSKSHSSTAGRYVRVGTRSPLSLAQQQQICQLKPTNWNMKELLLAPILNQAYQCSKSEPAPS